MPTSESTSIVARRVGSGPAMLLIHGVGMRAEYWSNIEADLAQQFSLIVIDMPGHGSSPLLAHKSPTLAMYTDEIATLLSTQQQPAIVVGHSMGALIALDMAVRYPALVSGIAVLNGVYRRSVDAQHAIDARVAQLTAANLSDATSSNTADSSATLERWFGAQPTGVKAQASERCRGWLASANPAGYLAAYAAFAKADAPTDAQLQAITCAALFMTGSLEPNSTPAMSQHMSKLVTGAKCVIVDDAKHMMTMTHGPQVVSAFIEFFQPQSVNVNGANNAPI